MNDRNVVITGHDYDRLSGLVGSPKTRMVYGSLAATLRNELVRGEVVEGQVPKTLVTMNSQVRIRDLGTDARETFTLVYPPDASIDENRLSVLAPLGTALLGAKVGNVVEVKTPGGVRRIKVEKILYQPEAAGDYHL